MADSKKKLGIFSKTEGSGRAEPASNADLDEGRIVSAGVGITEGENEALKTIADQHETSKNALMHLAVRLFIEGVRAGTIDLEQYFEEPERPKKRLKFRQEAKR